MARKQAFANGEFFHIYNQGVDKRIVFADNGDMQRFFQSIVEFNTVTPVGSLYQNTFRKLSGPTPKSEEKLVNIIAYCLNPNHFHLILEQLVDGGISEFMKRLSGGYTCFFNHKNGRNGSLFQGKFKAAHIDSNEYLLHVSAYVNLNDKVHQLSGRTAKLVQSKSSWREYTNVCAGGICEKRIVLEQFKNICEYEEFALSSLETMRERKQDLKDLDKIFLE